LVELLTGITLGKPLTNVATIRTLRDRHRVVGPTQDRLVTEVDDDHVRASMDDRLLAWREIEIEFGDETPAIARRLVKRLSDAGARPSRHPNKLARVRPAPTSTTAVDTPAGRGLVDYMTKQIDAVFAGDLALRRGIDPIHDTRVAIRRLRSTVRVFGKLHPKLHLPTAGVLAMGAITIVGSLFTLTEVINAAVATLVIIQSLAQVAAIVVLRRRQPNLRRPYRQWLFPVPTLIALVGWVYIYVHAGWLPVGLSLAWIAIGAIAYLGYAKAERTWPFGPKEIKEAFVTEPEGAQA